MRDDLALAVVAVAKHEFVAPPAAQDRGIAPAQRVGSYGRCRRSSRPRGTCRSRSRLVSSSCRLVEFSPPLRLSDMPGFVVQTSCTTTSRSTQPVAIADDPDLRLADEPERAQVALGFVEAPAQEGFAGLEQQLRLDHRDARVDVQPVRQPVQLLPLALDRRIEDRQVDNRDFADAGTGWPRARRHSAPARRRRRAARCGRGRSARRGRRRLAPPGARRAGDSWNGAWTPSGATVTGRAGSDAAGTVRTPSGNTPCRAVEFGSARRRRVTVRRGVVPQGVEPPCSGRTRPSCRRGRWRRRGCD